jgi:hypothetical protein
MFRDWLAKFDAANMRTVLLHTPDIKRQASSKRGAFWRSIFINLYLI